MWPVLFTKCELVAQLISPSKTSFCNLVEFSMRKFIRIQYPSYHRFKITSKNSHSLMAFQGCQDWAPIPLKNLVLILLNILWHNYSIFNNSHILSVNNVELTSLLHLGHTEPAPTIAPWRMNDKWSGNSSLLGFSSLGNHGG